MTFTQFTAIYIRKKVQKDVEMTFHCTSNCEYVLRLEQALCSPINKKIQFSIMQIWKGDDGIKPINWHSFLFNSKSALTILLPCTVLVLCEYLSNQVLLDLLFMENELWTGMLHYSHHIKVNYTWNRAKIYVVAPSSAKLLIVQSHGTSCRSPCIGMWGGRAKDC